MNLLRFRRRKEHEMPDTTQEHEDVARELDEHRQQMENNAKRLRWLEIEAGIYKPSPMRRKDN